MGNDERLERLIALALDASVESSADALQTEAALRADGIEPHVFSPSFERRMEKLLRRQRRAAWREKHQKMVGRMAASAALVIGVAGVTVCSVDAFRVPVMRFVLDLTGLHSNVVIDEVGQTEQPPVSKEIKARLPRYVPAGFALEAVQEYTGEGFSAQYSNGDGSFYGVRFNDVLSNAAIDTENAEVEEICIQGFPALIAEKDGRTMISCGINGHAYYLTGYLSREDAIKILESVE